MRGLMVRVLSHVLARQDECKRLDVVKMDGGREISFRTVRRRAVRRRRAKHRAIVLHRNRLRRTITPLELLFKCVKRKCGSGCFVS